MYHILALPKGENNVSDTVSTPVYQYHPGDTLQRLTAVPVLFLPFPVRTELPLHLAHASGLPPAVRADALSSCELITQSFMDVSADFPSLSPENS